MNENKDRKQEADVEDVGELTGENSSRAPVRNLEVNEVRFDGKEGRFSLVHWVGHKKGDELVTEDLGPSISIVILKLRRRIQGLKKGNKALKEFDEWYTSTEHNVKEDVVYLMGARDKGTAEEMYNKYLSSHKMRAQRIVYAFLLREGKERELVRVVVKGATLNSRRDSKKEGVMDYFDYISMKRPKDDHHYKHVTVLSAVEEDGNLGTFYTISFARGSRLPQEHLKVVVEEVKRIHAHTVEQDEYYKKTEAKDVSPKAEDLPAVEYPSAEEEGIDPADIPF